MGLKLKVCKDCGQRKKIGASKSKCKACRRGRHADAIANLPPTLTHVPNNVTATFTHTYVSRNIILKQMGFDTYKQYLRSQLWKTIKAKAFFELKRTCRLCQAYAEVLHHFDYTKETLFGLSFDGLAPLCKACHEKVENTEDGKRSFLQASEAYAALLKSSSSSTCAMPAIPLPSPSA